MNWSSGDQVKFGPGKVTVTNNWVLSSVYRLSPDKHTSELTKQVLMSLGNEPILGVINLLMELTNSEVNILEHGHNFTKYELSIYGGMLDPNDIGLTIVGFSHSIMAILNNFGWYQEEICAVEIALLNIVDQFVKLLMGGRISISSAIYVEFIHGFNLGVYVTEQVDVVYG